MSSWRRHHHYRVNVKVSRYLCTSTWTAVSSPENVILAANLSRVYNLKIKGLREIHKATHLL